MRSIAIGCVSLLLAALPGAAAAWYHGGGAHWSGNASNWHAQGFRGTASGGDGSWNATGYRGGSASGGDGSWSGTGYRGGTASGGDGSWSAHGAGGDTASGGGGYWHATNPNTNSTVYGGYNRYYGGTYNTYHPPTVVNDYYGGGCYDCGGWNSAGAAAVGLAAGTMIGAAATQQASANAYAAGVAAGETTGAIISSLPPGCVYTPIAGASYYKCGVVWYQPSYGANGVFYRGVVAP